MAETPSIDTALIDRVARRMGLTDAERPLSSRIERRATPPAEIDAPEGEPPEDGAPRAREHPDREIAEAARTLVEEIVPLVGARLRARRRLLLLCDLIWTLVLTGGLAAAAKFGGAGSGDALHALLVLLVRPVLGLPAAAGLGVVGVWVVLIVLGHFWFAAWTGGRAARLTPDTVGPLELDARNAVRRSSGFFRPLLSAAPIGWSHSVERRLRKLARGAR